MFNKKNDPLVQSVQMVMAENQLRRDVEARLNEELGIETKKALPFEYHANYDALLEQRIQEAMKGSKPRNARERELAAMSGDKGRITKGDVLKARGVDLDETYDTKNSQGDAGKTLIRPKPDSSMQGPKNTGPTTHTNIGGGKKSANMGKNQIDEDDSNAGPIQWRNPSSSGGGGFGRSESPMGTTQPDKKDTMSNQMSSGSDKSQPNMMRPKPYPSTGETPSSTTDTGETPPPPKSSELPSTADTRPGFERSKMAPLNTAPSIEGGQKPTGSSNSLSRGVGGRDIQEGESRDNLQWAGQPKKTERKYNVAEEKYSAKAIRNAKFRAGQMKEGMEEDLAKIHSVAQALKDMAQTPSPFAQMAAGQPSAPLRLPNVNATSGPAMMLNPGTKFTVREASEAQKSKVEKVMGEFKKGKLHSSSKKGPEVKSKKQAIAIALNQAGLSKKKDMNENEVLEEIRANLGAERFAELSQSIFEQTPYERITSRRSPYLSKISDPATQYDFKNDRWNNLPPNDELKSQGTDPEEVRSARLSSLAKDVRQDPTGDKKVYQNWALGQPYGPSDAELRSGRPYYGGHRVNPPVSTPPAAQSPSLISRALSALGKPGGSLEATIAGQQKDIQSQADNDETGGGQLDTSKNARADAVAMRPRVGIQKNPEVYNPTPAASAAPATASAAAPASVAKPAAAPAAPAAPASVAKPAAAPVAPQRDDDTPSLVPGSPLLKKGMDLPQQRQALQGSAKADMYESRKMTFADTVRKVING